MSCDSDTAVASAMASRENSDSSMPARPWVTPSHIAGTPPATCALPPALRAAMRIRVGYCSIRLVRREHVVVRGDDADVAAARRRAAAACPRRRRRSRGRGCRSSGACAPADVVARRRPCARGNRRACRTTAVGDARGDAFDTGCNDISRTPVDMHDRVRRMQDRGDGVPQRIGGSLRLAQHGALAFAGDAPGAALRVRSRRAAVRVMRGNGASGGSGTGSTRQASSAIGGIERFGDVRRAREQRGGVRIVAHAQHHRIEIAAGAATAARAPAPGNGGIAVVRRSADADARPAPARTRRAFRAGCRRHGRAARSARRWASTRPAANRAAARPVRDRRETACARRPAQASRGRARRSRPAWSLPVARRAPRPARRHRRTGVRTRPSADSLAWRRRRGFHVMAAASFAPTVAVALGHRDRGSPGPTCPQDTAWALCRRGASRRTRRRPTPMPLRFRRGARTACRCLRARRGTGARRPGDGEARANSSCMSRSSATCDKRRPARSSPGVLLISRSSMRSSGCRRMVSALGSTSRAGRRSNAARRGTAGGSRCCDAACACRCAGRTARRTSASCRCARAGRRRFRCGSDARVPRGIPARPCRRPRRRCTARRPFRSSTSSRPMRRSERSTLIFSLRTADGLEARRRLHRGQAQQLQHVVLQHVAHRAGSVVVVAAAFDADGLGHGDLHLLDVARVPQRLEQRVAEAQREQVLHAFLAEVVVDAEHAVFVEHAGHAVVDLDGAGQVVADRLFQHHARARGRPGPCAPSASQIGA